MRARDMADVVKRAEAGYTLVEIMIVIAIIGLLAMVGTLATIKTRKNVNINEATVQLEMVSAAVLELAWDTGRYPNQSRRNSTDSNDEVWDLTGSDAGLLSTDGGFTDNWDGPYLDEVPDDPWGNPYFFDPDYRINGANRIVVGSFGPNGVGRNKYDSDDIYVIID
jgi:general secretion pathway protein G